VCALESGGDPWRLLVMGRLSAQCTDARVNIVCRELFSVFPDAHAMAGAELAEVERIVRPCGLYHTKAQNIVDASRMLIEEFGGEMPREMEALLRFPGVGRKIANLLRGDLFGLPAIVADTHCIRLCGRFGMYPEKEKDPTRVEKILVSLVEPQEQSDLCHRLVLFGRDICTARSPKCAECPLRHICREGEKWKNTR
jgi:endonuclease-3